MAGVTRGGGGLPSLVQVEIAKVGALTYLGTIVAGGASKDNSNTLTPFTIPAGSALVIQSSAAFFYHPEATAAATITTGTALKVAADAKELFFLGSDQAYVCTITSGGAANVLVFSIG